MTTLPFPYTIFKTKTKMNDYGAPDMRCGDLTESQLTSKFALRDVSFSVDPYKLIEHSKTILQNKYYIPITQPAGKAISKQRCIDTLFDEMRQLSNDIYTTYGRYNGLIIDLINHMQHKNGTPFQSFKLDNAIEKQILNDTSGKNSTLLKIKNALVNFIDWENSFYPRERKEKLIEDIKDSILPKFTRFKDRFNGLGLAVHDTYATHITLKSLRFDDKENFTATVHYKIQDHFGLDDRNILNFIPRQFRFFQIWFVLQRYHKFAIKPFVTNMEATVKIRGNIRDKKSK